MKYGRFCQRVEKKKCRVSTKRTAFYRICKKEQQILKYRNIQVAKMTGVKILAGLLVFGLTFSAPATAWAAEGGLTEVTSNGSEIGDKLQA